MRFVTSMTASGVALGNVFCAPVIDSCLMDVSLVVAGLLVVPDPPGAAMGLSWATATAERAAQLRRNRVVRGRLVQMGIPITRFPCNVGWRGHLRRARGGEPLWITCANPVAVATWGWVSAQRVLKSGLVSWL